MRTILLCLLAACTAHSALQTDRTDCNTCHSVDYDTAPQQVSACAPTDHVALGFPRTCYRCHGTTAWCPADTMHTKFDISSASSSHAGFDCADCHVSITYTPPHVDQLPINCIDCHAHDKDRTDAIHLGKGGYSYGPATCLMCHLGGRQ
jgi:hypothetical protein